jgi:hypothetical protein
MCASSDSSREMAEGLLTWRIALSGVRFYDEPIQCHIDTSEPSYLTDLGQVLWPIPGEMNAIKIRIKSSVHDSLEVALRWLQSGKKSGPIRARIQSWSSATWYLQYSDLPQDEERQVCSGGTSGSTLSTAHGSATSLSSICSSIRSWRRGKWNKLNFDGVLAKSG